MRNLQTRYQRNEGLVFRKIKDRMILVPIRDRVGDMGFIYNLNEIGGFVWERLDGRSRLVEIRNEIVEEFDVSSETAERDLFEFIAQLDEIDAILQVRTSL